MGTRDGCLCPKKSMGVGLAQGSSWSLRCPRLGKGTSGAVVAKCGSTELGGDRLLLVGNTGESKERFVFFRTGSKWGING